MNLRRILGGQPEPEENENGDVSEPSQSVPSQGQNPWLREEDARQILESIDSNIDLKEAVVRAIYRAELEALNDSLMPYRRATARGTRAEMQALSYVGVALEEFNFRCEEDKNHFRFINLDMFPFPIRLHLCRGNDIDGQIETWKKGKLSTAMMNENLDQFKLFEWLVTQDRQGAKSCEEYNGKPILNVWAIADANNRCEGQEDMLAIHLIVPTGVRRGYGTAWIQRPKLEVKVRKTIFQGVLGTPMLAPDEKPEAAPIVVEPPVLRDDTEEQMA